MDAPKLDRADRDASRVAIAALWAAIAGGAIVILATLIALPGHAQDGFISAVWRAHAAEPLLWIIDGVPLALATASALGGRRRGHRTRSESVAREAETAPLRATMDELMLAEREAHDRAEFLFRVIRHGVIFADAGGHVIEWSAGAEALFNHPSERMLGRPLSDLFVEGERGRLRSEMELALQGLNGESMPFIAEGSTASGQSVHLEVCLARWQSRQGLLLAAVVRDASKQVFAERRLPEVERNWRDVAEYSGDALLLVDRGGTIVFANRGFLGKSSGELVGADVSTLLPESGELLSDALDRVFTDGTPFEHETRVAGQAREGWLWCRLAPQREDGEVVQAVLSISDFSEGHARDLARRRLASIVETTTDAVFATDEQGLITIWNRGAERLWGWTERDIVGRDIAVLSPPESVAEQRGIFDRLARGEQVAAYDAVRVTRDGRRIPVSMCLSAASHEAGQFAGISAVVRDMSHQRELRDELERAKEAAEVANRMKSEFLANMSHEIRTPLNGVVGMADLLNGTQLSAQQADYVKTLLEASQSLRVIIDDVLDFSKIEAGKLAIEHVSFDLMTLAKGAVDMFRSAAAQNESQLSLILPQPAPGRVLGDPHRIRQVLTNLVSNAVKFTKKGHVRVRLSVADVESARVSVRVDVEDTGVGIDVDAQERIFQPFAQADGSITRTFGGTGLGLSICRKLIELMAGRLGLRSQPGQGSTFWFELCLEKAKDEVAGRPPEQLLLATTPATGWRILVAEDNAINQKVVSAMLHGFGCSVDIAHDGREALELWKRGAYDLILTDCQMPVMSGYEVTRIIREIEGEMHTPIVAMTAQAYAEDRERCRAAGMDDHVSKPVTQLELRATLSRWLAAESTPVEVPAPFVPEEEGVDLSGLALVAEDLGEGGAALVSSLLESFIIEFDQTLAQLGSDIAAAAWERVAFEAHRSRSSAGTLTLVRLAALCKDLEHAARRVQPETAVKIFDAMRVEFTQVRSALREHLDAPHQRDRSVALI